MRPCYLSIPETRRDTNTDTNTDTDTDIDTHLDRRTDGNNEGNTETPSSEGEGAHEQANNTHTQRGPNIVDLSFWREGGREGGETEKWGGVKVSDKREEGRSGLRGRRQAREGVWEERGERIQEPQVQHRATEKKIKKSSFVINPTIPSTPSLLSPVPFLFSVPHPSSPFVQSCLPSLSSNRHLYPFPSLFLC